MIDSQKADIPAMMRRLLENRIPGILTQVCRDPANPAFGCFDRNWWHYRIRDFASIILQQGGYAVLKTAEVVGGSILTKEYARKIAAASCLFWNNRASAHGAFEEYYPWEQGYPPLAFSTLAAAKLAAEGIVKTNDIAGGLKKAARQLSLRFESKAANQQVAGLAALAWIRKICPELVDNRDFKRLKQLTLQLQSDEGWFWEYDGPDIGYLSVTIDCLWDLFDASGDADFRHSADRALDFIDRVVSPSESGLGMLNARNTDYVVPYGIARYLNDGTDDQRNAASRLIGILYSRIDGPDHFFKAVDDRYWCHYIGHSVARSIPELEKAGLKQFARPQTISLLPISLPECGYEVFKMPCGAVVTIALRKGGCARISLNGKYAMDFGWIVDDGHWQHVTHWWSKNLAIEQKEGAWLISGGLAPHKELIATPFSHVALRAASLVFGKSIISFLKNVMIFKKKSGVYSFVRKIRADGDTLLITDTIHGLNGRETIQPAPRSSKRHVASADSFSVEDVSLENGMSVSRKTERNGDAFTAETVIRAL